MEAMSRIVNPHKNTSCGVKAVCMTPGISRSTYYARKRRANPPPAVRTARPQAEDAGCPAAGVDPRR